MKNKRLIVRIESLLNKTPNIGILIFFAILVTMVASAILSKFTGQYVYESIDPVTSEKTQNVFEIVNFLNPKVILNYINQGMFIFSSMSTTVTILVTVIAFGVAEKSGVLYTVFKKLLFNVPKVIVTLVLVFVGIISNVSSTGELNAGYLVLLPLSAFIYIGNGRNPLAGIAAMFAAIFGGYSINVLLTTHTLVLNNITQTVASNSITDFVMVGNTNRAIMFALVAVGTIVITYITERYITNILPIYDLEIYTYHKITVDEKRGLKAVIIYTSISVLTYIYLLLPPSVSNLPGVGLLLGDYDPNTTSYATQLISSTFMAMFVIHISYFFIATGVLYGLFSRKFKSSSDIIKSSAVSVADHAEYFVLAFLLSQLIYVLYNSNISIFVLLKLTDLVNNSGGSTISLVISLIVVTGVINLLVPTPATKWSVMAPIIIPIFIASSINPALAQTAFQVGDSFTNTVTIIMPYTLFAYVLFQIYAKRTKQHSGNGTYFKLTVPYSIALGIAFALTIVIWILLNINLSTGVELYL